MKLTAWTAAAWLATTPLLMAQGRGAAQAPKAPPPTAKAAAPVDLTGYWVSIVTEDWRWRMVMPPKGDYQSVPITVEAKKVADAWDPAKDESIGEQCRAYGAAGIMRMPTRLHITWLDDNTLKVETDAGMQTRLFHFGAWKRGQGKPSWQGDSVAEWEIPGTAGGAAGSGGTAVAGGTDSPGADSNTPRFGNLKVVTTNMRPGYLRKNGVPYGASARLTEYFDVHKGPKGEQWLVVSTVVDDSTYLQVPWLTSPNFRKEPDGSKWDPTPCSARR
jgi:hypothetical protein